MPSEINQIKDLVKKECFDLDFIDDWFYDVHLLAVEKFAKELLGKLPKARKEIVMLGVWLHDLAQVRGIKGEHEKTGAVEAEKVLKQFGYPEEIIAQVKSIILTHRCNNGLMPKTLEGKILASADAMSHYANDFYLALATTGERDAREFKKWALEKIDRDFNKKIFFDFARKMVVKRHKILKEFLKMDS